jgi:hypothetical protein
VDIIINHLPLYLINLQNAATKIAVDLLPEDMPIFVNVQLSAPAKVFELKSLKAENIG